MKHIFMMHDTKRHHDLEGMIHDIMQEYVYEIIYTTSMQDSQKYIQNCLEPSRFYAVGGERKGYPSTINSIIKARKPKS